MKIQTSVLMGVCVVRLIHNITLNALENIKSIKFRDFMNNLCVEEENSIR